MNFPTSSRFQSEKDAAAFADTSTGYSVLESEDKHSGHRKWSAPYLAPKKGAM